MPFDPAQPYELIEQPRFDPGQPFTLLESNSRVAPTKTAQPEPKDELGIGEEVRGVGRSVVRGARRFVQMRDVATLRREDDLSAQLAEAQTKLPSYERLGMGGPQRERIAMLRGELENFRRLPADTEAKAAASLAEQQKKIEAIPLTQAQEEFQKKETPWWKFFSNPIELTATTTAESLPSMAMGLAGAPLGPAGLAATMGASSFSAESSARVLGAMQQQGVNLQKPDEVMAWFQDRAKSSQALAKADLAALGPATFDALTAGVAGRWLSGAVGKGGRAVAVATGKEVGVQMAGGGVGSIAGSALAGEKVDWKDVVLEMAAEIAPVEAVVNLRAEAKLAAENGLPATAAVLQDEGQQLETPLEFYPEESPTTKVEEISSRLVDAPVPETADAITKQLEVTLDPASTKAVTLITPGSSKPNVLPGNPGAFRFIETQHGLAIYNPAKTTREAVLAAGEGKDFDGTLLGMSTSAKPEPVGNTVVQTVKEGVPVLDEVVAPTPEAIAAATTAHAAAVPGGETRVVPAEEVLEQRTTQTQSSPSDAPTPQATPTVAAPTSSAGTLAAGSGDVDRGTGADVGEVTLETRATEATVKPVSEMTLEEARAAAAPIYQEIEKIPEEQILIRGTTRPTPEYKALEEKLDPFRRRIEILEIEQRQADIKAQNKRAAEARDKRIASAPVYQRRNGWEIVKEGAQYAVRDPVTKEEIYIGRLSRAREVANESKVETKTPGTQQEPGRVADSATQTAPQPMRGEPAATPAKAQAKMQAEVSDVARTEGPRPAKEIKSELIERLESALKKAPEKPAMPDEAVQMDEDIAYLGKLMNEEKRWNLASLNSVQRGRVLEMHATYKWSAKNDSLANLSNFIRVERSKFNNTHGAKITIQIPGDGQFKVINSKAAIEQVLDRTIDQTPHPIYAPPRAQQSARRSPALHRSGLGSSGNTRRTWSCVTGQTESEP